MDLLTALVPIGIFLFLIFCLCPILACLIDWAIELRRRWWR